MSLSFKVNNSLATSDAPANPCVCPERMCYQRTLHHLTKGKLKQDLSARTGAPPVSKIEAEAHFSFFFSFSCFTRLPVNVRRQRKPRVRLLGSPAPPIFKFFLRQESYKEEPERKRFVKQFSSSSDGDDEFEFSDIIALSITEPPHQCPPTHTDWELSCSICALIQRQHLCLHTAQRMEMNNSFTADKQSENKKWMVLKAFSHWGWQKMN